MCLPKGYRVIKRVIDEITLRIHAQVGQTFHDRLQAISQLRRDLCEGGLRCQILGLVRISFDVIQRFGGARLEELPLYIVQLAGMIQLTPFHIGQHLIAIIILQAIKVERLVTANVFVLAFAQRADKVVLLVESIGVAKCFVSLIHFFDGNTLAEERSSIYRLWHIDPSEF